jgi:hypothetical protein
MHTRVRTKLRRIAIVTALCVVTMASSVNLSFVQVQADEPGVNLYLLGNFWHVALGMDELDDQGHLVGITVYAFGAAEHYRNKYVNPERYRGLERLLYYVRLAFTRQAGSLIAWDVLKEPGMTRERFLASPDLRLIIRVHPEQAARIRRLIARYVSVLEPDPILSRPWRRAWYGEALPYSLFGFNCATFVARLLGEVSDISQRVILPSSLLKNFAPLCMGRDSGVYSCLGG